MYARISAFLFSFVLFVAGAAAQNLIVKKFYHAERDFTANSGSTLVLDANEEPCALIKVRTNESGFWFDSGRLLPIEKTEEQTQKHPGEIYVWVQSGAKRLSLGHKQLGSFYDFDMGAHISSGALEAGKTYILELGSGKVKVDIEEMPTQQYVVFQLTPADAVVRLGGQMLKTVDGTAMKLMDFGTYQYTVEAPDYQMEVGRIEVKDPENKHIIRVQLKSNFTQVTLTAPDGAEIWVNGEKKGSGQWTGNLGAGAYKFEAKKAGYRDSQHTMTLNPAAGPQTIALAAPTPILGKADISSEPALADIYIDGQKIGQTPFLASNLLVGSHSIRITRNGYAEHNGTLNIKEGEKASFTAVLRKVESDEELIQKAKALIEQQNYEEAFKIFRKSAEQGNSIALYNLGVCYRNGIGAAKDTSEALNLFHKAAEQGYKHAQYNLGVLYQEMELYSEAVKWYRKAAEQGLADAQLNLGGCYSNGKGVIQDKTEAVKLFHKAAEQGLAEAQFNLGNCYCNGDGVTQDFSEAFKWYRKSAELGYAPAQSRLGNCYYNGIGVTQDKDEACKWLQKAAEQGNAPAQYNLGVCYYEGYGVKMKKKEAQKWLQKAANQGYELAKDFLKTNSF